MGISQTWCQSGEFVLECEKVYLKTVFYMGEIRSMREVLDTIPQEGYVPWIWHIRYGS